ncbi:tryptophan--tRNA ligase [Candidatus Woesearchaeota archaeon]|nr:MAG: tryptophan--tRNA ligase [Candidatus Woesearchaeota archaeon]
MAKIIDPWGSKLVEDYAKLITDFHLEQFMLDKFPSPNRIMRRGVVFSGIGQKTLLDAMKNKKPFYVLSGIMPTADKIHFGNKMVVENIAYFQKFGAETYILIADLEAEATRGISLEEARKRALNFHIPAYIALGLDPEKTTFYFQSENVEVMRSASLFARKVTLNQFKALYGNAEPGRIFAACTQVGDILYPQFKKRMPGVIPVGVDQVPHILLTRDIVNRMKSRNFVLPSSIFHKYTPSLDGSIKMSKSKPESCIELPEDEKSVCKKIKRALTGGRDTLEEHRRLGAIIEKDMVFELLKQHLIEDDSELQRIHDEYKAGRMTSGEIKEIACQKMVEFMQNFNKKVREAKKLVPNLKFVK